MTDQLKKLNVDGAVSIDSKRKYAVRLKDELADWIEDNTTGSQNSVINFLINVGINQVEGILQHDSLYETIEDKED